MNMSLNTGFFKDSKDLIHLFYVKEQTGLAILVWAILQMLYKPNFWITQNYQNLLACARANVAGGVSETGLWASVPAAGPGHGRLRTRTGDSPTGQAERVPSPGFAWSISTGVLSYSSS